MFEPTKEQQLAIDGEGSILITAAAGSGKTAVLVERVVKMLCRKEKPLSVDRLLIVTFTNAAAAEMRVRIEKRLFEEAAKNPADRRLKKQLLLLPSAKICTIDTFCINLVRENFEHFSLSPDFKIITDTELYPLYNAAMDEILGEFYSAEPKRMRELLDIFGCGGDDRRLIDAVLKIFSYSTSMPFPEHWLAGCRSMYENAELTADTFWRPALEALSAEGDELFADSASKENLEKIAPNVITLLEITERFSARLFEIMCEKNMLTFYNTEQMALSLLCNPDGNETEKAASLSEEFDEILVDEYQDVNDLQDMLFHVLSSRGEKLFAVGDVKQSIYGFRGSNPENFMRKKDNYLPVESEEKGGKKIALAANFRSRRGICEYINYLFSLTMSRRFGGVDYEGDERLESRAKFPENNINAVDIELLTTGDGDDADAVAEAKHIAAYIKKTMEEEPFLRDGEGLRPATYRDFAILMRSPGSHAEILIKEMEKAGIPIDLKVGGFLQSREILAVLSLLKVISNPMQDVPLMALLLSPIFGFTHNEVASIRLIDRDKNLYSALLASEEMGNKKTKEFLKRIRAWRRMAATMPTDRLLSKLYDETGLLDLVLAMPEGETRRANLLKLSECARDYTQNGGSLGGFPEFVEKMGEGYKPEPNSAQNAVTVMSFHGSKGLQYPICIIAGSFHRFNKTDSTASLVMDRHMGVAFKGLDIAENKRINTVAREAISKTVAARNLSEELRILYVALTRAEERLMITMTAKDHEKKAKNLLNAMNEGASIASSAGSYYDWFMYALLRGRGYSDLHKVLNIEVAEEWLVDSAPASIYIGAPCVAEAVNNQKLETGGEGFDELRSKIEFSYPFADCAAALSKVSVSDIVSTERDTTYDFSVRPAFLSSKGLTPAQRGTATHKFMQFADYTLAAADFSAELNRLTEQGFITAEEAGAMHKSELVKFFDSELFRRMQKAELYREMRFITERQVGSDEYDATVVQGVIDCVIDEGESLSVLDFKTDRVSDKNVLIERYEPQLSIYAEACEKLYSKPVKQRLIYSFALGETIEL